MSNNHKITEWLVKTQADHTSAKATKAAKRAMKETKAIDDDSQRDDALPSLPSSRFVIPSLISEVAEEKDIRPHIASLMVPGRWSSTSDGNAALFISDGASANEGFCVSLGRWIPLHRFASVGNAGAERNASVLVLLR